MRFEHISHSLVVLEPRTEGKADPRRVGPAFEDLLGSAALAHGGAYLLDQQTVVAEVCNFELVAGCVLRISSSMAGGVGVGAEARREAEMHGEGKVQGVAEVSRVGRVKTWVEVII
jgi:hypothetical protein